MPHPEDTDAALENPQRPNDTQILRSMPGVGMTVASVLLSEAHDVLARRDYESLRCLSGVAPVTRQSGKSRVVRKRPALERCPVPLGEDRDPVGFGQPRQIRRLPSPRALARPRSAYRCKPVALCRLYHVAQRRALSAAA